MVVLLVAGAVVSCKRTPDDDFRARAEQLRWRMTPSGGTASEPGTISHSGEVTRIEWQLSCPLGKSEFRTFLSQRLEPEFSKANSSTEQVVYVRYADGDSEQLEITEVKKDGDITQYSIQLRAMPG